MNKKGFAFSIIIAVLALIVLTSAFRIIYNKEQPLSQFQIGKRQAALLDAYQESEKAMYAADIAAHIASERALFVLQENGGNPSCSKYLDYSLWPCKVDYDVFEEELNRFLTGYTTVVTQQSDYVEVIGTGPPIIIKIE